MWRDVLLFGQALNLAEIRHGTAEFCDFEVETAEVLSLQSGCSEKRSSADLPS